jgi:hypothetical protein
MNQRQRFGQLPWMVCVCLILAAGCKKDSEAPADGAATADKPTSVVMRSPVALLKGAADKIPVGIDGVLVGDVAPVMKGVLGGGVFGIIPPVKDPSGFRADLGRVYKRFLGLDITGVDHVVGFFSIEDKMAGAFIAGDFGEVAFKGDTRDLSGLKATALDDDVFVAAYSGGLLVGNEKAFAAAKGDKLAGSAGLAVHIGALGPVGNALVAFSVVVPADLRDKALEGSPVDGANVTHVSGGLGSKLVVAVAGDDSALERLQSFVDLGLAAAKAFLGTLEAKIDKTDDIEEALGGVAARHLGAVILDVPKFTNSDGVLSVSIDAPGGSAVGSAETMWILGVSAAVAIPAFIKYMRKVKAAEARDNLDKLYKGAAMFYASPRVAGGTGAKLPCQFPPSVTQTPKGSACDHPGERFPGTPEAWADEGWSALNFAVHDKHYFSYQFESSGSGADAQFTARAHADLDCDGIFSTFERMGHGSSDCSARSRGAMFIDQETE